MKSAEEKESDTTRCSKRQRETVRDRERGREREVKKKILQCFTLGGF